MENNIYPIFSKMQTREEKERLLGQRGITLWFTGLSGSGKSTVAIALEKKLSSEGILCRIIDGDNVRCGLNAGLGFSPQDRKENIRRIAEVCKLFTQTGIVTLATFISPTREIRGMARDIIGEEEISAPFEEPEDPAVRIDTSRLSLEESVRQIAAAVMPRIRTGAEGKR